MNTQFLSDSFAILASMIGEKFGVQIEFTDDLAGTDGKVIYLPAVESAPDTDLLLGYLLHEAGHIRFKTEQQFFDSKRSEFEKSVVNIFEDHRINTAIKGEYPGGFRFLDKIHRFSTKDLDVSDIDTGNQAKLLRDYLLSQCWISQGYADLISGYFQALKKACQDILPSGLLKELDGLTSNLYDLGCFEDSRLLGEKVMQALQRYLDLPQPPQPQPSSSGDSSDDKGDAQAAQGAQSGEGSSDGSSESSSEGSSEGSQDDSSAQAAGSEGESISDDEREAIRKVMQSTDSWKEGDLTEKLKKELNSDQAQAKRSINPHLVGRGALGSDQTLVQRDSRECLGRRALALYRQAMTESVGLRRSVEGLLQARARTERFFTNNGRRITGSRLAGTVCGRWSVFEKKREHQQIDTAVHILLDLSGSMERSCEEALKAAFALVKALESIPKCSPALTVFPCNQPYRTNAYSTSVLKHGEKINGLTISRISSCSANGYTPLAEALMDVKFALSNCRATRKLVFVITDGQPQSKDRARDSIRRCESVGIQLLGVGINVDVKSLFKDSVLIHSVSELQTSLLQMVKRTSFVK